PSLRTGQAGLPHPALPAMGLPPRGLTRRRIGSGQGQVPVRGKVRIRPPLMIPATTATTPARTLAQKTPQAAADPAVHRRERGVVAMLEVSEPAPQRPVEVRNDTRQRPPVRPLRFRPDGGLELVQALLPRPMRQVTPPRRLEVVAQVVKSFP